jgi:hypothetical protein
LLTDLFTKGEPIMPQTDFSRCDAETLEICRKLQSSNRRLRFVAVLALAISCCSAFAAFSDEPMVGPAYADDPSREIFPALRTRSLEIVDESGVRRILLSARNSQPRLVLKDSSGRERAVLELAPHRSQFEPETPGLFFKSTKGEDRLALRVSGEDETSLGMLDHNGRLRLLAQVLFYNGGTPLFQLWDDKGKVAWTASIPTSQPSTQAAGRDKGK